MNSPKDLRAALLTLPNPGVKGYFYRAVAEASLHHFSPPNALYALGPSKSGQRFTPPGGPPALYVTEQAKTAVVESTHAITSALLSAGLIKPMVPLVIFTVDVKLDRILDLTDKAVTKALGTTVAELKGPWAQQMKNGDPVPTHILADAAYASPRYQAIKYWSLEDKGGTNLVIWTRKIRTPCFVEVFDPSNRLAARIPKHT